MTPIEQELLAVLRELDRAVTRLREGDHEVALTPLFTRLDGLAATLPPTAPRDLRHYLGMKSYEKARRWLEREETRCAGTGSDWEGVGA
ncbi:MAG: hypothetical protein H7A46_13620 [Verrucomicrobiales bacterium]|nr:hypothetical protein [Verrucomicrobiales bacterium]